MRETKEEIVELALNSMVGLGTLKLLKDKVGSGVD